MRDLYNWNSKFDKRYKQLQEKDKISKSNRALLIDFFELLKSEGISKARRYKYLCFLPNILNWIGKDFENITKEDLIKLSGVIRDQNYTLSTQKDYLLTIKKIYKTITVLPKYEKFNDLYIWLYDRRNKFYSTNIDKTKLKTKEEWFSEEDVMKIITHAKRLRDKAFFSVLATQGLRPEEIMTIRRNDVHKVENGLRIKVSGKTGVRDIFIYENFVLEHFLNFFNTLPEDSDYIFKFGVRRANVILKQICQELNINKRAYLYKLRKLSVTRDRILGLSTGAMEQKYGWIKGTKIISHYDKSIAKDYKQEMQERYGIVQEKKPKSKLIDKICLRCNTRNNFDREYCSKCGLNLNTTKEELEKEYSEVESLMERIIKHPKFKEMLKDLV